MVELLSRFHVLWMEVFFCIGYFFSDIIIRLLLFLSDDYGIEWLYTKR